MSSGIPVRQRAKALEISKGKEPMPANKGPLDWLEDLLKPKSQEPPPEDKAEAVKLQPALRRIGITDCPICQHEVAVYLTKTNRPFVNCGFCSARVFYNGRESMRRLRKVMKQVDEGVEL
jgi:hypothetical protein